MKDLFKAAGLVLITLVVLVCIAALHILSHIRNSDEEMKPYVSYVRMVNLASGIEDYKKRNATWPQSMVQVIDIRPDLAIDATDAYESAITYVPYRSSIGYGELVSYGADGKAGGSNRFDADIHIRFPTEVETNSQWNEEIRKRFKDRSARGL